MSKVIDQFLDHYIREHDFYREAAKLCSQQCSQILEENGIRVIVSDRAKRPDRLKNKLIERNKQKKYSQAQDIYKDIKDIAGVRVALYFPGDLDEVTNLIKKKFIIKNRKTFPEKKTKTNSIYIKQFSGYKARHFIVNLKQSTLGQDQKQYKTANIEIQVASVLIHAWAEVEHDLAYKEICRKKSMQY